MPEPIIRKSYARLGLVGNPTDALGGCAIAVTIKDLWAESTIIPSDKIQFIEPAEEIPQWDNLDALLSNIQSRGYYGGRRLILALLDRLQQYCQKKNITLHNQNFTISWKSIIPLRVGLSGSTALLNSALRSLMAFYQLDIPLIQQVDMILKTETDNLGIPAGHMDRVTQVYEGLVFYEFIDTNQLSVQKLDTNQLPPLFVAIDDSSSEGTEVFHSGLRQKFLKKDPVVLNGIEEQTELTRQFRKLILDGKGSDIGPIMDRNFDIRQKMSKLNPKQAVMITRARESGAHANFAGSGGAIVGTCPFNKMNEIIKHLEKFNYKVFQPKLWTGQAND